MDNCLANLGLNLKHNELNHSFTDDGFGTANPGLNLKHNELDHSVTNDCFGTSYTVKQILILECTRQWALRIKALTPGCQLF